MGIQNSHTQSLTTSKELPVKQRTRKIKAKKEEKNQLKLTQMLKLEDKNFKASNLTMLKDVKDNTLITNKQIGNGKEMETIKK